MQAMRRKLVWVERMNFQGWICTECAWVFNPSGSIVDESIDEMKMHYEQQRDKEFASHVCAEPPEPQEIPVSQITRGLNAGDSLVPSKQLPFKEEIEAAGRGG